MPSVHVHHPITAEKLYSYLRGDVEQSLAHGESFVVIRDGETIARFSDGWLYVIES